MNYRIKLIRIVTFLGGLYFFLRFILPPSLVPEIFQTHRDDIENGMITVGAMAIGLGLINLLLFHGSRIVFKRTGWFHSLALLGGLAVMLTAATGDWFASLAVSRKANQAYLLRDFVAAIDRDAQANRTDIPATGVRIAALVKSSEELLTGLNPEIELAQNSGDGRLQNSGAELLSAIAAVKGAVSEIEGREAISPEQSAKLTEGFGTLGTLRREILSIQAQQLFISRLYLFLQDGLFVALGSAMFSLLAFYITAAAYRAFRIKSAESALMMTAALLVMLGQISFSAWIWDGFPAVRLWILETPNSAAFRAIRIGAAIAGLVLAVRMWLSIETESFTKRAE